MDVSLASRIAAFRRDLSKVRAHRDIVRSRASALGQEVDCLRYGVELHQKASEVLKNWLEDSLRANVDSMASLGTSGLRHIIHDQQLTFSIAQEPKNNRMAMRFVVEEDGVEGDPVASFGGGAVLVISLVLRLAVMARLKMGNLLLLDESLSALANRYVPGAASFLRQLSEQTGINILMVTHNEEFMSQAHTAYDAGKDCSLRLSRRRSVG